MTADKQAKEDNLTDYKKKDKNKQGSMFDARNFKGNVELFMHLNEISNAKLKQKIEPSSSIKVAKRRKGGKFGNLIEDYGATGDLSPNTKDSKTKYKATNIIEFKL